MLIAGKTRIIFESKKEFDSILKADSSEEDKLNEFVKLWNYLKETYIQNGEYEEFSRLIMKIDNLYFKYCRKCSSLFLVIIDSSNFCWIKFMWP